MARRILAVAVVFLVVFAGCQSPMDTDEPTPSTTGHTEVQPVTQTDSPPTNTDGGQQFTFEDPSHDVLGWENGYWYNESITVTVNDGLNASERKATVSRAMARVEHIRRIEFTHPVPIDVISRETYQQEYVGGYNVSEALQTFDDTKYEALFLIGESKGSLDVQESNRGSNVLGFYSPKKDHIVIISASDTPIIEEITLGHELLHALQFRHFSPNFSSRTRDAVNAHKGLIEGAASFLDNIYKQNCGTTWTCVSAPPSTENGGSGDGSSLHFGVYIMKYFPYSDGPGFIKYFYQRGGWDRVAQLYENPANTSEQVAIPPKYGTDMPTDVVLPDRSDANWDRVTVEGRAPFAEVGVGGLTAMFAYPAYHAERTGFVVSPRDFLNFTESGNININDPFDYTTPPVEGWDGAKMYIYENNDGQTAYVWRIAWDSTEDAQEFLDTYRELLKYWGAHQVSENIWRIPEGESPFADAFRVTRHGDVITIVNAPTIDQLDNVHAPSS